MSGKSPASMPKPLAITSEEIALSFVDAKTAAQFPPVLNIEQAAKLFQISVRTMKLYLAQDLLAGATSKIGKHRRIWRDRAIRIMFSRGHTRAQQLKLTASITERI